MSDQDQEKTFSADDLALVNDDTNDADENVDKSEESSEKGVEDAKVDSEPLDESDKSDEGGKSEKRGADTDTLLDDLDDDSDEESKGDDKKDTKEEKSEEGDKKENDKDDKDAKEEKQEVDWRAAFIAKALKGQEDKLTAAKLEKRREALTRELKRYKSAEDYMLAGLAAREKLRSGEYRKAKPDDDASDEEKAAWRKEMGIPEEATAYEIPKIAGHKWTDEDDPFIDSFKEFAHKANYTQEQMNTAAEWYAKTMVEQQDQYMEIIANTDREDREAARDTLRAEIGNSDFKPSLALMERIINDEDLMPNKMGETLLTARYQDENGNSRRLINNPDFARFLINTARETYGEGAMISGDVRAQIASRKAELEKLRDTDIKEYFRQGADKELLEIERKEEAASRRRGKAA